MSKFTIISYLIASTLSAILNIAFRIGLIYTIFLLHSTAGQMLAGIVVLQFVLDLIAFNNKKEMEKELTNEVSKN